MFNFFLFKNFDIWSSAILNTLIVKNTHFPQFTSRNWKWVCTPHIKFCTYGVHFEFCDGHIRHCDSEGPYEIHLICAQNYSSRRCFPEPPQSPFGRLGPLKAMYFHFICWITLHFKEFQSAAIEKNNNLTWPQNVPIVCSSVKIIFVPDIQFDFRHIMWFNIQ